MISEKQKKILAFQYSDYDCIICDGAVRSGKTSILMWSFVDWAMRNFSGQRFGICAKTVGSAEQNIIVPFTSMAEAKRRYHLKYRRGNKILEISRGAATNWFELFGGKDESSYALVQGRTFGGCLLDEVVLMPESFANQAFARCSLDGAKIWFSCNPGNPNHWFYQDWILRRKERNALYLRFSLEDNPSLSKRVIERYKTQFSGVFYERYVLGKWVQAEGLVYPNWKDAIAEPPAFEKAVQYVLSIDYGTQNAFAALLWGKYGDVWYAECEYYYSGRDEGIQKTDEEYGKDLDDFVSTYVPNVDRIRTIIDPSAASFIALLRKRGHKYRVIAADNAVIDGIRETATAIHNGKIKVSSRCENTIKEFQSYVWDDSAAEDRPIKADDHCMDSVRYMVKTMRIARKKAQYLRVYE